MLSGDVGLCREKKRQWGHEGEEVVGQRTLKGSRSPEGGFDLLGLRTPGSQTAVSFLPLCVISAEKIARIVCLMSVLHLDMEGNLYWVKWRHHPPDNSPATHSGASALVVLQHHMAARS